MPLPRSLAGHARRSLASSKNGTLFLHEPSAPPKELAEGILEAFGQRSLAGALPVLEGTEFDQTDGGGKLRLVEGRFEAADGIGFAEGDRHLQHLLGQFG